MKSQKPIMPRNIASDQVTTGIYKIVKYCLIAI